MVKCSICMIAYANYFTDARIKNYVDALLKAGYQVDVFALGQKDNTRPGLRVFCLMPKVWSSSGLPYIVSQLWFLLVVLVLVGVMHGWQRYRLIHVHNMPNFLVFGALIPRLFGARVVLDVHDTMPEAYATKFDLSLRHPLIGLLRFEERLSAAYADHVITTNDLHKEALTEHGIPAKKISIIMNVGNEAIFFPRRDGSKGDGLTLVYHGTIAARLGLDLILQAIKKVLPSCPHLRFILIGGGDYLPTVEGLISAYNLDSVVQVVGWIPVERLPDYLQDADVGIVGNRRYTEARQNWMLPVKMLEYAAMEIPTIAPRLRVIAHYFNSGTAIFYEPDDSDDLAAKIYDVYAHREYLTAVRRSLQYFNTNYNWSDMESNYLELVCNLQQGHRN